MTLELAVTQAELNAAEELCTLMHMSSVKTQESKAAPVAQEDLVDERLSPDVIMQQLDKKSAILDDMSSCLTALKELDKKMAQYENNEKKSIKKIDDMLWTSRFITRSAESCQSEYKQSCVKDHQRKIIEISELNKLLTSMAQPSTESDLSQNSFEGKLIRDQQNKIAKDEEVEALIKNYDDQSKLYLANLNELSSQTPNVDKQDEIMQASFKKHCELAMKNIQTMSKKGLCIIDNNMSSWAKAIVDNKLIKTEEGTLENDEFDAATFREPRQQLKKINNQKPSRDDDDIMSLKIEKFERFHDEEVHYQCNFEGQRFTKEIDTISLTDY